MEIKNKRFKKGTVLFVALLILAAMLLNVVMWLLPRSVSQKDMTENELYTLSEDVDAFLKDLDREITLYLIDAGGGDQKFE